MAGSLSMRNWAISLWCYQNSFYVLFGMPSIRSRYVKDRFWVLWKASIKKWLVRLAFIILNSLANYVVIDDCVTACVDCKFGSDCADWSWAALLFQTSPVSKASRYERPSPMLNRFCPQTYCSEQQLIHFIQYSQDLATYKMSRIEDL